MAFMGVLAMFAAIGFFFFVFCIGIVCLITAIVLSVVCSVEKKKKGRCGMVKKFFMIGFWIVSALCLSPILVMLLINMLA